MTTERDEKKLVKGKKMNSIGNFKEPVEGFAISSEIYYETKQFFLQKSRCINMKKIFFLSIFDALEISVIRFYGNILFTIWAWMEKQKIKKKITEKVNVQFIYLFFQYLNFHLLL